MGQVTKAQTVREILDDIILDVSWLDIAKDYFGKSPSWIYQKMQGRYTAKNLGFTPEETEILKGALCDLADRIRTAADKL